MVTFGAITITIIFLQDPIMSETSTLKGQCIAEFLGTGLLIFFGVVVWRR
ncbi:Aquaglyceroporin [Leclercia adecarboxylata]|uniref:Aquaglyceroporin n=1 Tax=Leclercia adecarboxylata TaxID=83655 RepID=A0A4U9J1F4_9ENTR|nr:Aquaglyceroporin [Leclercia adecarboxylata]